MCVWLLFFLQIAELQGQVGQLQNALTDAERRVLEGEMVRRKLHNIIQVRSSPCKRSAGGGRCKVLSITPSKAQVARRLHARPNEEVARARR